MNKKISCGAKAFFPILLTVLSACSMAKYSYHSLYEFDSCPKGFSRDHLNANLMKAGFLHSSERQGPYDIFHKANIAKKGFLAAEAFEDRAGQFGVTLCQPYSSVNGQAYVLAEEWKSCENQKDCTKSNQEELKQLVEKTGCRLKAAQSAHSETWKLENRQDWNGESCQNIISSLKL